MTQQLTEASAATEKKLRWALFESVVGKVAAEPPAGDTEHPKARKEDAR